jgi:hypothetical protein
MYLTYCIGRVNIPLLRTKKLDNISAVRPLKQLVEPFYLRNGDFLDITAILGYPPVQLPNDTLSEVR